MTLLEWNILFILSIVSMIAFYIILNTTTLKRNRFYHSFHEDELSTEQITPNSKNKVYFTDGETSKFVKKYVICRTSSDRYLICNYAKKYKKISYFVMQYTKRHKMIGLVKVTELLNNESSKIIALSKKCEYVNVVINRVDDVVINTTVIIPKTKTNLRVRALLESLVVFMWAFVLRHIFALLVTFNLNVFFLNSTWNALMIVAGLALAILYYIFAIIAFKKNNNKLVLGGAVEYEFL